MTVSPALAALLAWAFLVSLILNWYWSRKLAEAKADLDTVIRISAHNTDNHFRVEANWVSEVLSKAQLTDPLPALNSTKFRTLQDLYASDEMQAYRNPAQITTDHDDRPAVYWKITSHNELDAYELARLWLNGVL